MTFLLTEVPGKYNVKRRSEPFDALRLLRAGREGEPLPFRVSEDLTADVSAVMVSPD